MGIRDEAQSYWQNSADISQSLKETGGIPAAPTHFLNVFIAKFFIANFPSNMDGGYNNENGAGHTALA